MNILTEVQHSYNKYNLILGWPESLLWAKTCFIRGYMHDDLEFNSLARI